MGKPKTKAQQDRDTDRRLQKAYNISLAEYESLLRLGEGRCWICGKEPVNVRLSVDHDHSNTKVKIYVHKLDAATWVAQAFYNQDEFTDSGSKRAEAVRGVKRKLLRASIRGLACVWCNRGLRYYHDNPSHLRAAAGYLENFIGGETMNFLGEK